MKLKISDFKGFSAPDVYIIPKLTIPVGSSRQIQIAYKQSLLDRVDFLVDAFKDSDKPMSRTDIINGLISLAFSYLDNEFLEMLFEKYLDEYNSIDISQFYDSEDKYYYLTSLYIQVLEDIKGNVPANLMNKWREEMDRMNDEIAMMKME